MVSSQNRQCHISGVLGVVSIQTSKCPISVCWRWYLVRLAGEAGGAGVESDQTVSYLRCGGGGV